MKLLLLKEWYDNFIKVNLGVEDVFLFLDVRNGYEWDVGYFRGVERSV